MEFDFDKFTVKELIAFEESTKVSQQVAIVQAALKPAESPVDITVLSLNQWRDVIKVFRRALENLFRPDEADGVSGRVDGA